MPNYPYSFQLPPLNVQDIPNDGAPGEFLGISAGGALDWLPVATGGGDMLKSENLSGLANYTTARTNIGLGTASTPTFANLTLTSPSLTSSAPVTISQTWNGTGSTVFKALMVNATTPGTTSSSSSLLLDLQVGGVSRFSVDKGGQVSAGGGNFNTTSTRAAFTIPITIGGSGYIGFGPFFNPDSIALDTILLRDGAGQLALRNGALPQTFNVYGTYTSGSAYERMFMRYNGTALAFQVGAETVGATARPLEFLTAGTRKLVLTATGNNTATIYSVANSTANILTLRNLSETAKFEFNLNASGNAGLYLGTNTLISEVGSSYFNGGNVGIGTTAPSEKLHVLGGKVLFGDAADVTGTAGNGDLTLRAYRSPQIHISANTSSSVLYGLNIELNNNIYAGLLLNLNSGEVKIGGLSVGGYFPTFYADNVERMRISAAGNVGIGTTSPSEKLHVAGNSNPSVLIENTLATGYSQFLFKNTVTTGASFFLNGSTQTGYGGPSSFNIIASTGPIGFHTASVTNALSIAQNGVVTFAGSFNASFASFTSYILTPAIYKSAEGGIEIVSDGVVRLRNQANNAFTRLEFGVANSGIMRGTGSPEGVVTALVGSLYLRTDGGASTTLYVKESGTGNTGWVGK